MSILRNPDGTIDRTAVCLLLVLAVVVAVMIAIPIYVIRVHGVESDIFMSYIIGVSVSILFISINR